MNNLVIYIFFINLNINFLNENINLKKNENIEMNKTDIHSFNEVNKKNLILGIIEKNTLNMVLPFFKSLIKSGFQNCDIVIFVRSINKILINYLQKIGVLLIRIPDKYKNISIINLRWEMYVNYLERNKNSYNLVFHCDIRDTFFQKDVFNYYNSDKPFLGISLEDGKLDNEINKKWIIDYAGEQKFKEIQNERIICVGTLWGTDDKFLEFSKAFSKKLKENPQYIEQGIANYMFYYEKFFNNCIIKSDNTGFVMTIGLTDREKLNLDLQDNILNFNGQIAAVIHQYDRKPDIAAKVIDKYCPELLTLKKRSIITIIIIEIFIIILICKAKLTLKTDNQIKSKIYKIIKSKN